MPCSYNFVGVPAKLERGAGLAPVACARGDLGAGLRGLVLGGGFYGFFQVGGYAGFGNVAADAGLGGVAG